MSPEEEPPEAGPVIVLGSPAAGNRELVKGLRRLGLETFVLSAGALGSQPWQPEAVIARLDVLPSLDGVESGLLRVLWLERQGVRVLNTARGLLTAHDKLLTARRLAERGLPHPRTVHATREADLLALELPLVLKPRFGSWGHDVMRCRDRSELELCLEAVRDRRWFRRHGVLVQELLPPAERDLRVLVAADRVVGAAARTAGPSEWRTNVSLGGTIRSFEPPEEACELALAAAAAVGCDLVGVDLYPVGAAAWVVLELNGAADFDDRYSLAGRDVYRDIAGALELLAGERAPLSS